MNKNFLAVGGAHWDILGRASERMALHDDVGGRIRRMIGGVAGPIAMKLGKLGADIELICYAGHDELGEALLAKLAEYHVRTGEAVRGDLPTDVYMGIEAQNGLIAAIADCHSLEAQSDLVVDALFRLSKASTHVIIDGNIRDDALEKISKTDFPYEMLTLVPASPSKISRFAYFIGMKNVQLIVNKREAEILAKQKFANSIDAALALCEMGFISALVSDGGEASSFATNEECATALPPQIEVKRFTGAGDTLAAHFLYGQMQGYSGLYALQNALNVTSEFISCEDMDA